MQMKKWLVVAVLMVGMAGSAAAQGCSVCTKTASGLADKSAKGLNGGIIYLAFLPLVIMGSVGFVWWRSNRSAK